MDVIRKILDSTAAERLDKVTKVRIASGELVRKNVELVGRWIADAELRPRHVGTAIELQTIPTIHGLSRQVISRSYQQDLRPLPWHQIMMLHLFIFPLQATGTCARGYAIRCNFAFHQGFCCRKEMRESDNYMEGILKHPHAYLIHT